MMKLKDTRMMKSATARRRRKTVKKIVEERTENFYARMRKVRKKK